MAQLSQSADICLIVEGAYPYVAGGVSSWLHDLIQAHRDLSFHLIVLSADSRPKEMRFTLPPNVVGMTEIPLQQDEARVAKGRAVQRLVEDLDEPLSRLLENGDLADFKGVLDALRRHRGVATRAALMNSEAVYAMIERMYERTVRGSSFLNYFWTWRALAGGLFSVLLADLPKARVYHAISTGYAGLAAARAALETGRPALLTEHGIYTNERRVEIAMADWLADRLPLSLELEGRRQDLRDVWMAAFSGYARTCYQACSKIITLYAGNQVLQKRDGAPPERLSIIPNGIDYDFYSKVERRPGLRPPTVALIGRVVPIKDVKTYIRTAAILRDLIPDVRVLVLGPTEEDAEYFSECQEMVAHLGLGTVVDFKGRVKLADYLGEIDVIALTSISEAQPLVLLEAGAVGVPSVATDVGSCGEIINGRPDEDPQLGAAGYVVPLSNPLATARALAEILRDEDVRSRFGSAIQRRTERYYNKNVVDGMYRALYDKRLALPDQTQVIEETSPWLA
jgi:glycosyltransferase involved in cell wall biosynthesis